MCHTVTNVSKFDQIFVMVQGQVVESGNHQQLWDMRGHYWTMWRANNNTKWQHKSTFTKIYFQKIPDGFCIFKDLVNVQVAYNIYGYIFMINVILVCPSSVFEVRFVFAVQIVCIVYLLSNTSSVKA